MRQLFKTTMVATGFALAIGCGGGPKECKLDDPNSCPSDQICEQVKSKDKPMCFAPVQLEGRVVNLSSGAGIVGAHVTALDANGAPVAEVAVSGADGAYSLRVPSIRTDEKGAFEGKQLTLRASASDHLTFPSGLRVALPLDTSKAARDSDADPYVLKTELTEVALISLPADQRGRPKISGSVELASTTSGALVAAETSGGGVTAVADKKGSFTIFNVAPGSYQVQAYSAGSNYTAVSATVTSGKDTTGVSLKRSSKPTATVSGSISLVAGANGAGTSVVLALESTFNAALERGEVVPGLRAPGPGVAPNLTGAFTITGVPDGKYAVLAAFENDGNVRDPDPNISGTAIQHIEVINGATTAQPAFKVTGAMEMVGPGAGDGAESITGTPRFEWKPYSSAKTYDLIVFDVFGNTVWSSNAIAATTGSNMQVNYGGTALEPGVYQWRATAKGNATNPISRTEDLRGVFRVK
jgi:hypothetical protein